MKKTCAMCLALALSSISTMFAQSGPSDQAADQDEQHKFSVSSATFTNGDQLPLVMVLGSNYCTYVSGGGDESPELSWSNAPHGTRSFVVTFYDVTAAFTHWGMYNISPKRTGLPENAGVAGSSYGKQVFNDFYLGAQYDGPCPPNSVEPYVHDYVLTVYALDKEDLCLPSAPPIFPANAETLYRAMLGHVLGRASIHGHFSTAD